MPTCSWNAEHLPLKIGPRLEHNYMYYFCAEFLEEIYSFPRYMPSSPLEMYMYMYRYMALNIREENLQHLHPAMQPFHRQ